MKQKIRVSMLVTAIMAMVLILPAAQAAVIVNEELPISILIPNDCTGDIISSSTTIHQVLAITDDGAGGFHVKTHLNTQDGSAVGLPSGLKYEVRNSNNFEMNVKAGQEQTFTMTFKLISQGGADNLVVKGVFHITINPDGTVTSFVDTFTTECRG